MDIAKIVSVYLLTTLKFFSGPLGGYLAGFNMFVTMIVTVAGMMTSVVAFTYFGEWMKNRIIKRFYRKDRKVFSKRNRRVVKIWKRYGPFGVAALTPILLMPIGGTLILTSFSIPRKKIMTYMLISAVFWGVLETILIYTFGKFLRHP